MNHVVPDWNAVDDARPFPDLLPVSNLKTTMGPDHELVELLWQNGHPVLSSQTHRKPLFTSNELKQVHRPDQPVKGSAGSTGNMSNLIQEDETASWLQYPIDESLEKDFCSEFFYEMPTVDAVDADRLSKEVPMEAEKCPKFGVAEETNSSVMHDSARSQPLSSPHSVDNGLPTPRQHVTGSVPQAFNSTRIVNFSHFARPVKADKALPNGLCGEKAPGNVIQGEVGESSIITVGSSHCGSNHVQNETNMSRSSSNAFCHKDVMTGAVKEDACKMFPHNEMRQMDVVEPTVTSSSGQSGGSLGRMAKETESNRSHKRKGRDAEEPECYSEEAGYESAEANKPPLQSASARRSRAAEVHNLSERRRRDRINEKMKALQELIPHCNKSDKASMLDEAIEYLKSLQLQVQIMWMGSGMAPMMFPSVQHYLARMSLGMGHSPLPSIHGTMQLPSVPIVNQSISSTLLQNQPAMGPSPVLNPINFHNQIQNANMSETYAHYLGFHPMQMAPQAMNLFTYGAQTMSQTERTAPPSSNGGPCNGVPSDDSQHSNLG